MKVYFNENLFAEVKTIEEAISLALNLHHFSNVIHHIVVSSSSNSSSVILTLSNDVQK